MLYDEFGIASVSAISADNKGSRRAPTLIFYQKVDFTKIYEIKNKTMLASYYPPVMSHFTKW